MAEFTELLAIAIANAIERRRAGGLPGAHRARRRRGPTPVRAKPPRRRPAAPRLARAAIAQDRATASRRAATRSRAALSETVHDLNEATDEVREIAQGIHPAILTQGGLAPALRTLALRSSIPVEVIVDREERLPEPVEAAVVLRRGRGADQHRQACRGFARLGDGRAPGRARAAAGQRRRRRRRRPVHRQRSDRVSRPRRGTRRLARGPQPARPGHVARRRAAARGRGGPARSFGLAPSRLCAGRDGTAPVRVGASRSVVPDLTTTHVHATSARPGCRAASPSRPRRTPGGARAGGRLHRRADLAGAGEGVLRLHDRQRRVHRGGLFSHDSGLALHAAIALCAFGAGAWATARLMPREDPGVLWPARVTAGLLGSAFVQLAFWIALACGWR